MTDMEYRPGDHPHPALLKPVAEKYGKTLAQLAINWNLCQPGVTTALAGAKKPQ